MSTIEFVTITISSIAIGASVVSILLFVLYAMLQRRLILQSEDDAQVPEETAAVMKVFGASFKDELPEEDREVLKTIAQRYSQTSLSSVFSDPTERTYLIGALSDPSKLPWDTRGQRGERRK